LGANGFQSRATRWAILMLALSLSYVVSFGPACWVSSRADYSGAIVNTVYQPLLRLGMSDIRPCATAVRRYAGLGAAPYWTLTRTIDDVTEELGPVEWRCIPPFF
jgi:hypothetical protein